jgi:uncharacterized membrane protein YcaP (DUF421 family)
MQLLMIDIWGYGKDLTTVQIAVRAFTMFFIALALVRLGGLRIFSKKSAFDNIVSVMLGAVLSRGITGAAPFGSAVAAGAVFVVVHRLLSLICIFNPKLATLINGKQVLLYSKGRLYSKNLTRCSLSEEDLLESLRLDTQKDSLDEVESAYMENNGNVSFILKKE